MKSTWLTPEKIPCETTNISKHILLVPCVLLRGLELPAIHSLHNLIQLNQTANKRANQAHKHIEFTHNILKQRNNGRNKTTHPTKNLLFRPLTVHPHLLMMHFWQRVRPWPILKTPCDIATPNHFHSSKKSSKECISTPRNPHWTCLNKPTKQTAHIARCWRGSQEESAQTAHHQAAEDR